VSQQTAVDIEEVLRRRLRELEEREKGYKTLCINIPVELYDKLTLIAQSNNVDREKLVLDLLKTYVEGYYKSAERSESRVEELLRALERGGRVA
jgi:hypothetical protein